MAYTETRFADTQQLGTAASAAVINSSGQKAYVHQILAMNCGTAAAYLKLYRVPDVGGTATGTAVGTGSGANQIYEYQLAARESKIIDFVKQGVVLKDAYDSIQWNSDVANSVVVSMDGATSLSTE